MSKPINTKYIYFLLPLTYVFVCVFITINYLIVKDLKEAIKTMLVTFLISSIFYIGVPIIMSILKLDSILNSWYYLLYFYIISTIFGIYLIKKQQRYLV